MLLLLHRMMVKNRDVWSIFECTNPLKHQPEILIVLKMNFLYCVEYAFKKWHKRISCCIQRSIGINEPLGFEDNFSIPEPIWKHSVFKHSVLKACVDDFVSPKSVRKYKSRCFLFLEACVYWTLTPFKHKLRVFGWMALQGLTLL